MSKSDIIIKDTDHGLNDLRARLKEAARGSGVSVGIHAKEGALVHKPPPEVTRDEAGRPHVNGKRISEKAAAMRDKRAKKKRAQTLTIADIGAFNEFGLGVPERSFIRAWFDEATEENRAVFRNGLQMVVRGKKTLPEVLELVGLRMVGKIQQRIAAGIEPENSPETIKIKGSSKPLIDTGQLRQSITYLVRSSDKPKS